MKNCRFIIGNSSSGIHEAPYFFIPAINVGNRQNLRSKSKHIINSDYSEKEIKSAYLKFQKNQFKFDNFEFGEGKSNSIFIKTLNDDSFWNTTLQKFLNEI